MTRILICRKCAAVIEDTGKQEACCNTLMLDPRSDQPVYEMPETALLKFPYQSPITAFKRQP